MAKIFTIVFFLLISLNSFAQETKEEILLKKLASAKTDSLKADVYIDLHNEVFKAELEKAKDYANYILKFGLLGHNWKQVETGYLAIARCERKKRNYDEVFSNDFKALEYAKKTGNLTEVFSCNSLIANDYMDAEKSDEALKYLLYAEDLANQTKKLANIGKAQESLGYYYNTIGKPSQAVLYLRKAIINSTAGLDFFRANRSRTWLAECLVQLNWTAEVPEMIFTALDYYKKANIITSQADCYKLLGFSYTNNNNPAQGIKNYLLARQIYETTSNKADQGLVDLDLSRCYIINKEFESAKKMLAEADALFTDLKYQSGLDAANIRWGQFYTEIKQFKIAEPYFHTAQNIYSKAQNQAMLIENEIYWAANAYRQKNNKLGDSLTYNYTKRITDTQESGVINNLLVEIKEKNKQMSDASFIMLKTLYTKGGAAQLHKKYGDRSLKSMVPVIDSLNMANPYSDIQADSIINLKFNNQLLGIETQYHTRLKNDSLKLERQNATIVKNNLKVKENWLYGSSAFVLLLSGGFLLQRSYRKRAEADKERIELLKNEIHHRVKNNLGVITRLVDVAEKANINTIPLASLKSRVSAIGLLHQHLYQDKLIDTIDTQQYLTDLVATVKDTFETDQIVSTEINAPIFLSGVTSEKIGLIVNELVTNSFKYAFSGTNKRLIKICAKRSITGEYELQVCDNGKGLDLVNRTSNYGMKLIAGLCQEVNGVFKFSNYQGTQFDLKFTDQFKR